jgi:NAD(P)-dependent dehydrogenase (short-subunit alcohol dehydrogenase family)
VDRTVTRPVVIVTGANSGIGLAASHRIARRGATLIMACRSTTRGEEALRAVRESSGNDDVHLELLDTSSLSSVHQFARRVPDRWPSIDALINNAGAFDVSRRDPSFTDEGLESIWATNYVGPWLLTRRLLAPLRAASPGRVIDVSSKGLLAFPFLKVDADAAAAGEKFSPERAYYQSKLAALTHTMALAAAADPGQLVAHAVWVPAVKVALDRVPPLSPLKRWAYMLKRRFALEPEQMADTYSALALDHGWGEQTGALVDHEQRTVRPPARATDSALAEALENATRAQVERAGFEP